MHFRETRISRKSSSEAHLAAFPVRDYGDLDNAVAGRGGESSCFQEMLCKWT